MKKTVCRILPVLMIALVIAMGSGAAFAQLEVFSTDYYANNTTTGAPAATLRFSQHDSLGQPQFSAECAMIYVFAADQQLTACCGCPVTTNGLQEENVRTQLTNNPLTGIVPNSGVIDIVSAPDTGVCDPTTYTPAPEVDSWLTHVQNKGTNGATGFAITEGGGEGNEEYLTSTELAILQADCSFVGILGSGQGTCTCSKEQIPPGH
jgi:hypothetical protein